MLRRNFIYGTHRDDLDRLANSRKGWSRYANQKPARHFRIFYVP